MTDTISKDLGPLLGPPQVKRWHKASSLKEADFKPPRLAVWNYGPCERHDTPQADCMWRACGGHTFKHQDRTAAYSYVAKKSIVANSTGTGKQQPVSEPVLTPSGWRTMGDLKVGDYVIGKDGKPTKVLEVHPQTERRTFKLTFNDGSWTLAGPDHLWLAGAKSMLHQGYSHKVVTTMQMKDTLHRQWSIPMVDPVEFPEVDLPCDPYLLGLVLGDGNMTKYNSATLCTDTEAIVAAGLTPYRDHETSEYTSYATVSRELLGGCLPFPSRSWEKEIPEVFMRGSSEDRLALLQGLMDSDGSPMRTGGVEFASASETLAEQVIELTQSLGGVARMGAPRIPKYSYKGEMKEGRMSWRVNVKLPPSMMPFRLQRKLERFVPPAKYLPKRVLRSVEQVGDQDSVCITVAAEDSLYVTRNYIVTHNTLSALMTIALAHHYGEKIKTVIVVPSISVKQWTSEAKRWVPGFSTVSVPPKTPKKDRLAIYASKWDLLIIGYHVFSRDIDHIEKVEPRQVIVDDIDPALNVNNATWNALSRVCTPADIVIMQNATPVAMNLTQMYAATALIGGRDIFGSMKNFTETYVKKENVYIHFSDGTSRRTWKTVGYKNMDLFRKKFDPMSIRITYEDIVDDVDIPSLVTEQVYLDMSKTQRLRYQELQTGVRTIMDSTNMPAQQKAINALTAFTIGSQICAGTFALKTSDKNYEPDGPDASPKLDWIMEKLTGEWVDEKVVVYAKFRGSILALQGRLKEEEVGFSTVWGMETDPEVRKQEMDRFWQDPDTKVMIISVSGERSLNLQNSRILVMWDMQLNPSRTTQLAGRVRRVGSKYNQVFVFQLLHNDSQEERYMAALSTREALFNFVFDVDNSDLKDEELLIKRLDPTELLKFISP